MTVTRPAPVRLRRRLAWTAALMLISLGGGGLTTTADRPATDATRPELSAHSDRLAQPWLADMRSQAHVVEGLVDALSQSGRNVLGQLPGLDPAQISDALVAGDQASSDLELATENLSNLRHVGPAELDENRLSQANRALLVAVGDVIGAAQPMPDTWRAIATDTREVSRLLVALLTHDGLVFSATSAGRQTDWRGALDLLAEGDDSLAEARLVRDELASTNDVTTLDDLLARYQAYDEALTNLYTALRQGAALDSTRVKTLSGLVRQAEAALPADTSALKVVVADASGGSVADGVVSLEEARGTVSEALAALP